MENKYKGSKEIKFMALILSLDCIACQSMSDDQMKNHPTKTLIMMTRHNQLNSLDETCSDNLNEFKEKLASKCMLWVLITSRT